MSGLTLVVGALLAGLLVVGEAAPAAASTTHFKQHFRIPVDEVVDDMCTGEPVRLLGTAEIKIERAPSTGRPESAPGAPGRPETAPSPAAPGRPSVVPPASLGRR